MVENDAVIPEGKPLRESVAFPLNPLLPETYTYDEFVVPIPSVREVGPESCIEGATIANVIVAVFEIEPEVPVIVSVELPNAAAELEVKFI